MVHLHEVFSLDALQPAEAITPIDTGLAASGMDRIATILATYTQADALRWIVSQWPPSALLARRLLVFGVLGEVVVELRPEVLTSKRSPLRGATKAEDVIAFLLDPRGGEASLEELLTYLVELLHLGSLGSPHDGRS
jgi:hypothetical protein